MKMSTKWADSIVGEHIELVYGKSLPDRDRQKGEFPVYGSNGIVGQHNQFVTKGPGIVIGRKGTVGQVTLSKKDFWPIDTTYYVKLKQDGDIFYWFYLLQTFALDQMNSHSAVPGLNRDNVYSIPVKVPSLVEQKRIAKILCDLDNKIELNQQMNKTLEAMAQALFKEWFVDFRFPGYENAKFIDGLPEGWRMGALGELISIESGKRPGEKSEVITDDFRVPLIGASSVMGYVKDALYKEPILIIGRVGTHGIVQRVSWPAFPSDNTLVIRSKAHEYVYQILRMIDYQSLNVGTTQPLITQTAMKNFVILIPAGQVLEKFEKCVSNLFEKIVANNCETEFLIGLRDFLLPKLFSGYINTNQEA